MKLTRRLWIKPGQLGNLRSDGVERGECLGFRQRVKLAPKAYLVSTQLTAEFAASGRVYGRRGLSAVLRAQGLCIGRHRVRRLMRESRLRALWRRKFVHTNDSGHALLVQAMCWLGASTRAVPTRPG